tara:strand:- start:100 stop:705 length:606 start_codon:yes stop_codon:yes gene_type:complete
MPKKIFIDGGGWNGCSTQKFLKDKKEKDWNVFIFEPNKYLKDDLSKIVEQFSNAVHYQKAISTHNDKQTFYIIHTPAAIPWTGCEKKSGSSSLLKEKIDWKKYRKDYSGDEKSIVHCIDLSAWILNNFTKEDYIVLKLDIEGAEYDVLEKIIEDGAINLISELYMEWHYNKVNIPKSRHDKLLKKLDTYNIKKDYNWNGAT